METETLTQVQTEPIRAFPEGADPKFLSGTVLDAVDGVLETNVEFGAVRPW